MTNIAVTGTQWGDEGKGKIVDLLARRFDLVIRFQGGHNAGHSVVFDDQRYALHVLPSGVFHPGTVNLIGNGVVVEPFSLIKEIEGLQERGISITPENLKISNRAHLIMPYHGIIDRFRDSRSGERKIGTTGRGIGPAYEWKAARRGFRFCDALHPAFFEELVRAELSGIHRRFGEIEALRPWTAEETLAKLKPALSFLAPYVVDSVQLVSQARREGKKLLFEGAQATLLDIDFGTYPYVTSSNSCAVGITAGAGVPPAAIDKVVGIFKAYISRVGEGPFPSELKNATGDALRKAGHEFGTTTGRPRRCGWLDLVALRYAHQLNGFDTLAMMKLDVLSEFDQISVCESYNLDGRTIDYFPASLVDLQRLKPNYSDVLPGWKIDISAMRRYEQLPLQAREYIERVEAFVGCPIGLISVGPDREQTIIRDSNIFVT